MIVTGIGTRYPSQRGFEMLYQIARRMAHQGWNLRSGGAIGCDTAWENGWLGFDTKEIYVVKGTSRFIAKDSTCGHISDYGDIWFEAEDIASKVHPRWEYLDEYAQALHTRNVFQVLGLDLKSKADVVAAYAPPVGVSVKGGTATAFNLARAKGIPTFNLWLKQGQQQFFAFVLERMGLMDAMHSKDTSSQSGVLSEFFEFV
ncbi:DNA recombination-mediator protein A [compost metagenome]